LDTRSLGWRVLGVGDSHGRDAPKQVYSLTAEWLS
jgi:hypothetical protein